LDTLTGIWYAAFGERLKISQRSARVVPTAKAKAASAITGTNTGASAARRPEREIIQGTTSDA